jgi:hypothetical protein
VEGREELARDTLSAGFWSDTDAGNRGAWRSAPAEPRYDRKAESVRQHLTRPLGHAEMREVGEPVVKEHTRPDLHRARVRKCGEVDLENALEISLLCRSNEDRVTA